MLRRALQRVQPVCVGSVRLLYSDTYLQLSDFRDWKASSEAKVDMSTAKSLRTRIQKSAENGLLLSSDLELAFTISQSERDLPVCRDLVLRYIELCGESKPGRVNAGRFVNDYYKMCHMHRLPGMATDMYDSLKTKDFAWGIYAKSNSALLTDLLFETGRHDETFRYASDIIAGYEQTTRPSVDVYEPLEALTLGLLALCGPGEDVEAAFQRAQQLMDSFMSKFCVKDSWLLARGLGRADFVYAWLASRAGKEALAFEACYSTARKSSLKSNLALRVLTRIGRIEEAVNFLGDIVQEVDRPDVGGLGGAKPVLCSEVIDGLAKAVKQEASSELAGRLADIFKRLDFCAQLTEQTILQLLHNRIEGSGLVRKKPLPSMPRFSGRQQNSTSPKVKKGLA